MSQDFIQITVSVNAVYIFIRNTFYCSAWNQRLGSTLCRSCHRCVQAVLPGKDVQPLSVSFLNETMIITVHIYIYTHVHAHTHMYLYLTLLYGTLLHITNYYHARAGNELKLVLLTKELAYLSPFYFTLLINLHFKGQTDSRVHLFPKFCSFGSCGMSTSLYILKNVLLS